MTEVIDLDSLLKESVLQQEARKLNRRTGTNPRPTQLAAVSSEVQETAALLRQWDAKREWSLSANVLVFTRQKCACCEAMSKTLDGRFLLYQNNRLRGTTKLESTKAFELDKPREVVYRDSVVDLCHECADIQQDWPLQED